MFFEMPKSASMYVCAIMKKETTIAQPAIVLKLKIQKLMFERQLVNEFLRSKSYLSMCRYNQRILCIISFSLYVVLMWVMVWFVSSADPLLYMRFCITTRLNQVLMMKEYQYIRNKTVECCVNIKWRNSMRIYLHHLFSCLCRAYM